MAPRRILIVIDGMEVGGSQRQIVHFLSAIDRTAWAPEIAFFRGESFLLSALEASGIPLHRIEKRHRFDPRFLLALIALLRTRRFRLIHAFSLTAELWSAIACMAVRDRPVLVVSERNQYLDKPAWYWWLKSFVIRRSAAVIANSRTGAAATARKTDTPESRFDIVVNGVQLDDASDESVRGSMRADLCVPPGRMLGLFVGRLVEQKNLGCLVDAMARISASQRPFMCIVGSGPLRRALELKASEAGIGADVRFAGERDDVRQLMLASDFFVLPSHFEGVSNALLEAMAAGCPVIASRAGGTPEVVIDGENGLLFPPDSPGALAECITRLVADPGLRLRLGRAARGQVERNHGVGSLVARTCAIYERCLKEAVAPRAFPPRARLRRDARESRP